MSTLFTVDRKQTCVDNKSVNHNLLLEEILVCDCLKCYLVCVLNSTSEKLHFDYVKFVSFCCRARWSDETRQVSLDQCDVRLSTVILSVCVLTNSVL